MIELPFSVQPESVRILGYNTLTGDIDPSDIGIADILVKPTGTYQTTTTIYFKPGTMPDGMKMGVTYKRRVTSASILTVTTKSGLSRGDLTLTWPVMSSRDSCLRYGLVGYYHMKIPRVAVTQKPAIDTSRSSAAQQTITFTALDKHKQNNKWYDLVYEPVQRGVIGTNYSDGEFLWDYRR